MALTGFLWVLRALTPLGSALCLPRKPERGCDDLKLESAPSGPRGAGHAHAHGGGVGWGGVLDWPVAQLPLLQTHLGVLSCWAFGGTGLPSTGALLSGGCFGGTGLHAPGPCCLGAANPLPT